MHFDTLFAYLLDYATKLYYKKKRKQVRSWNENTRS